MPGDYVNLWMRLCTCAGTRQPSRLDPLADEHHKECPYRQRVEAEATTTTEGKNDDHET